jgi:hypothetical protein
MNIEVVIPKLHAAQKAIVEESARFNAVQCGRRFGKTTLGKDRLIAKPLEGKPAAWFAPTYKLLSEVFDSVESILGPAIESSNKQLKEIKLVTGGCIDFWSLEDHNAGRGRKYASVVVDEAGIVPHLKEVWQQAIRPTLTDYKGEAWLLGTPKGRNFFHECYTKGQDSQQSLWKSWRRGSVDNPLLDPTEIEDARRELPKAVFDQEYRGIPADDGGNPFGLDAIRSCLGPISDAPAVAFGADLAKSQDFCVTVGLDIHGCVCHFDRWQSDWKSTTERLQRNMGWVPSLVDSTGVGDPIVEDLQRSNSNFEGFKFTQTAKQQIMEGLSNALQRGLIRIPTGVLHDELESFTFEYSKRGVRYTAPQGMHDDCVCALALAVHKWRMPSTSFQSVEGIMMGRSGVYL